MKKIRTKLYGNYVTLNYFIEKIPTEDVLDIKMSQCLDCHGEIDMSFLVVYQSEKEISDV